MKGRVVVKIQESAENYLETIHMLSKHKPYVRSIDIANELSFSKPSVSVAMKNLRENGYIHMDDQGHITLTQTGQDIADKMYERHIMLSTWAWTKKPLWKMPARSSMFSAPRVSRLLRNILLREMSFLLI